MSILKRTYCSVSFNAAGTGSDSTGMPSFIEKRRRLLARGLAADAALFGFAAVRAPGFVGEAFADILGGGHHLLDGAEPARLHRRLAATGFFSPGNISADVTFFAKAFRFDLAQRTASSLSLPVLASINTPP